MSDVSENEMPCENAYFSCQIFLRMKCPVKMYLSDVKAHISDNEMPCEMYLSDVKAHIYENQMPCENV